MPENPETKSTVPGQPRKASCIAVVLPAKEGAIPVRLVADSIDDFLPQLHKTLMEVKHGWATLVIDGQLAKLSNPIQVFVLRATVNGGPVEHSVHATGAPTFDEGGRFDILN